MIRILSSAILALLCFAPATLAEELQVRISKETTFVTEPRTADGFVDLAGAINSQLSKGMTTENNAAAVLYCWIKLDPEIEHWNSIFYKELGVSSPPKQRDYFQPLEEYLDDQGIKEGGLRRKTIIGSQGYSQDLPWKADDCPVVAAWLKEQQLSLNQIASGLKRDHYYTPVIPAAPGAKGQGLIAIPLNHVMPARGLGRAFLSRAALNIGEGRTDDAWQDILATLRLGRHIGHGASTIDWLVGLAIEQMAYQSVIKFIEQTSPDHEWVRKALTELSNVPKRAKFATTISLHERLVFIDVVMMISVDVGEREQLLEIESGLIEMKRMIKQPWFKAVDWNETLRVGNNAYNKLNVALKRETHSERVETLEIIRKEISRMQQQMVRGEWLKKQLQLGKNSEKSQGKAIGHQLVALLVPQLIKVVGVEFRTEQRLENARTALALQAYRAESQTYPETLTALVPDYLDEIPEDLFVSKPLIYQRTERGYFLYSVGINREDDQGLGHEQGKDDLVVKMPSGK